MAAEQYTCSTCGESKPRSLFYQRNKTTCAECVKARIRRSRLENPKKHRDIQKRSYEKHKERHAATMKAWKARNPDRVRELRKRENKERLRAAVKRWTRMYPWKARAITRAYQAKKRNATPRWADKQAIYEKYELAHRLTQDTGIKYHVDHIVPIRHELVCGLHVEHNLQVIPAFANMSKGNRIWPDMPS